MYFRVYNNELMVLLTDRRMLYTACRQFRTTATMGRVRYFFFNKHKPVKDASRQEPDYFEKQAAALSLG